MKRLLFLPVAILIAVCCRAQCAPAGGDSIPPLRPVTSAYMLETGSSSVADSYLSPITYRGWSAAFAYERMQAMKFDPDNWVMQLNARIELDRGRNHADNATTWRIDGTFSWGMLRRWHPLQALTIAAGGSTGIDAGCIYNPRNSNNPASAKLAWTVNATAYAAYNLRVGRLPVTLRYQPVLPLAGIFFAPEYDELYYEIYLGNHDGIVHFAWPGNRFAMTNLFTADLHFGATSLRLGYRGYTFSSKANDLVTNIHTHAFVIGLSGEWLSLSRRRSLSRDARIISALY
ncbi:MAG: hypothetical protein BHV69_01335 [Bacteroidales bacterium 52_46]|nr:MAG: hypothetical protein BHV69_01335 [Bacteroidales bacterium 52_46]